MNRLTLLAVIAASTLAAGCLGGGVGYSATVSNAGYGPDLVSVGPGVQVIADYDEPIFYADSFYWRYDGMYWYRSPQYTGGWSVYSRPPRAVLQIERPRAYAHYRPQGWAPRHAESRARPVVRDHRENVREAPRPSRDRRHDDKHDHR